MKRFIILFSVAVVTFGIIYLIKNPDLMEGIWLYVVGLFGAIVKFGQAVAKKISSWFKPIAAAVKPDQPKADPISKVKNIIKIVTAKS